MQQVNRLNTHKHRSVIKLNSMATGCVIYLKGTKIRKYSL